MSDQITAHVEGLGQAIRNLKTLDRKMARRVVSAAVRAGDAVIVKEARMLAPVRSGQMRRQIRGSVKLHRGTGTVQGTVKQKSTKRERKKGQRAHALHLVVGGTKPHEITTKKHGLAIGGAVVVKTVHHPGSHPNPFMDRAAAHANQPALAAFGRKFKAKLDEEVAKLPKYHG